MAEPVGAFHPILRRLRQVFFVTVHSHLLNGYECRSGSLAEEGLNCIFNECQAVSVESSAGFDHGKNHTHALAA